MFCFSVEHESKPWFFVKSQETHLEHRRTINLGFALTIALMLALGGVGLTHIHLADARLKNIVEKNNVKTEMAQIMQSALHESALNMHIIAVLTDDFLKDEVYQRFIALGGEYTRARQVLEQLADAPEEKEVLANIKRLTQQAFVLGGGGCEY